MYFLIPINVFIPFEAMWSLIVNMGIHNAFPFNAVRSLQECGKNGSY